MIVANLGDEVGLQFEFHKKKKTKKKQKKERFQTRYIHLAAANVEFDKTATRSPGDPHIFLGQIGS